MSTNGKRLSSIGWENQAPGAEIHQWCAVMEKENRTFAP
jgi:hypothetical protein